MSNYQGLLPLLVISCGWWYLLLTAVDCQAPTIKYIHPNKLQININSSRSDIIQYMVAVANEISRRCIGIYRVQCTDCGNSQPPLTGYSLPRYCLNQDAVKPSSHSSYSGAVTMIQVTINDFLIVSNSRYDISISSGTSTAWKEIHKETIDTPVEPCGPLSNVKLEVIDSANKSISLSYGAPAIIKGKIVQQICWINSKLEICLMKFTFTCSSCSAFNVGTSGVRDLSSCQQSQVVEIKESDTEMNHTFNLAGYDESESYTLSCTAVNQYGWGEIASATIYGKTTTSVTSTTSSPSSNNTMLYLLFLLIIPVIFAVIFALLCFKKLKSGAANEPRAENSSDVDNKNNSKNTVKA